MSAAWWVDDAPDDCAGCAGCDACDAREAVGEILESSDSPADDGAGYVRVGGDGPVALIADGVGAAAARRRDLERRQVEARGRYVAPADLVPWRGVLGFTEAEAEAYGVRSLPGASPRLAAYVGRLSDGPTVSYAWWLAWCQVTGTLQRFDEPDRGDPSLWISRKLPSQIAQRVRRLAFDSRPYVGGAA